MLGFLIIATGNYYKYLPNLIKSIEKFFPSNLEKKYYIFSNHKLDIKFIKNYQTFYFKHQGFPSSTLLRFRVFDQIKDILSKETERLFYIDADSLFVRPPIDELFDKNIDIFGFEHGENIVRDKNNLPYERSPSSLACVNYGDERKYIIGGFYGGNTKRMIEVFSLLNNNVDKDLQNNIIAKFHDESHMNNYFVNNKDTIILNTKNILGEVDSYRKLKAWNINENLETCRDLFILNNNKEILTTEDFFVIFLEKDHNKERNYNGSDTEIILN
jgi:hypothetical protein